MATYNSAQNGNWNTDATWTEAGHPNANDDIAIITHDVTYDVGVSAVTWGNCTINSGGILIFPTGSSSKMLFNSTGVLTVSNGGELRVGTSGTPIGSTYLCQIHWPQGASARNNFVLNNGGIISVYGDPVYYGSAKTAILDSQWNAGGGLTLYVGGDYSAKWVSGQHFIIHDFAIYANYQTDAEIFEIDSVGAYDAGNDRTPIVVTAAGDSDTFLAGAKLWMIDRNVELGDPGSSWTMYGYGSYAERLRFDNNQDIVRGTTSNVNFDEALFRGWDYTIYGGDGFTADGTVFLNCNYIFMQNYYAELSNCLAASCNTVVYLTLLSNFGMDIVGCNTPISNGSGIIVTGDIVGCLYAIQIAYTLLIGNVYSCSIGLAAALIKMIGNIEKCLTGMSSGATNVNLIGNVNGCSTRGFGGASGSHIGSITNCGTGIYSPSPILKHRNGEMSGNTADISIVATHTFRATIFEDYTIGGTKRELEIYTNAGKILCFHNGDAHWQAPPSGESFILEFLPNSACNGSYAEWLSLTPDFSNLMFTYVTSGAKTLTFKIYPVGWSSSLDNEDIVLEVFYLAGAGAARTRAVNTTATYANAGWRDLSISFTAGQDGIVYFAIHLKKYEAGDYVLIDPEWTVS